MQQEVPFSNDDTSERAADMVRGKVNAQERVVIAALVRAHSTPAGGMTTEELVEATGLLANSARPRLRGLVERGRVADSGIRRPGTRSGYPCIVWAPTFADDGERKPRLTSRAAAAVERERARVVHLVEQFSLLHMNQSHNGTSRLVAAIRLGAENLSEARDVGKGPDMEWVRHPR